MTPRHRSREIGPALLVLVGLLVAACTVSGASPSSVASISPAPAIATSSPDTTMDVSPPATPSEPSASDAVLIRTLGATSSETFRLLLDEILARGEKTNCGKTIEGEAHTREDRIRDFIENATGVERMIGDRSTGEIIWLGTLEGYARDLGSVEVVVPEGPRRFAYAVLRVREGSGIDAPVGSLAGVQLRRIDVPSGASVPQGTDLWLYTGNLVASVPC